MAKMLSMRDCDFSKIGNTFELDEVTPKMATEERLDDTSKKSLALMVNHAASILTKSLATNTP